MFNIPFLTSKLNLSKTFDIYNIFQSRDLNKLLLLYKLL